MEYSLFIVAVCGFVENHVKTGLSHEALEQATGFTYAHIRKTFRDCMQVSLGRYILLRRLSYAAFELIHTDRRMLDIALDYGFEQYDAFTRAFKRETGVLPSDFRRRRMRAGRKRISAGVFAPAILEENSPGTAPYQMEENMNNGINTQGSCILMGVPKVEYRWTECTPFPSCLKACLNYMGQDISYAHLMAASGAAFRLRWSKKFWDGGNVDIMYIYEDGLEAFRRAFDAAGRECRFLMRQGDNKQEFIDFIRAEIDAGRPVIAAGIIGPPEACIIAGYRDDGNTLLGWNFFQHRPEYNKGVSFHENGYFISTGWWENKDTILLMAIGEKGKTPAGDKAVLENAIALVDRKPLIWEGHDNEVACGQEAYRIWAEWIGDDRQFGKDMVLPLLYERHMCQVDAQTMVGEGRYYAAEYLKEVAGRHPEAAELCRKAAEWFMKASQTSNHMYEALGKGDHESQVRRFAEPDTRRRLVELIGEAAECEAQAMAVVKQIVEAVG